MLLGSINHVSIAVTGPGGYYAVYFLGPDRLKFDLTGPASVPPGVPGSGCDPDDGWRRHGETLTYRNVSGAFPPACGPGSARGLRTLRVSLKNAGDGTVRVRALVLRGVTASASTTTSTFRAGRRHGGSSRTLRDGAVDVCAARNEAALFVRPR